MPEAARRVRVGLVVLACLLAGAALGLGSRALIAVIVALPPLALALLPRWWWTRRGLAIAAVAAAVVAGAWLPLQRVVALLVDHPERSAQLVPLAVQCWCGIGLTLAALCGAARAWRACGRWWLAAPAALLLLNLAPLIGLPLRLLYPAQVTGARAAPVPARAFTVVAADGTRLAARLDLPPAEPLGLAVFTHGKGAWKERHPHAVALLRERGWAVVTWDLRGHGESTPAACGHGVVEADDLVRVWDATRGLCPGLPMVAFGISLGGAITLFAGDRLEGCGGLMIENSFADLDDLVERNAPGPTAPVTRLLCRLALGRWPREIRPLDAPVLRAGPPVLLGISGADEIVPNEQGERLAAACARAEVVRVPGIGHLDLVHSEAWQAAVTRLLARLAAPSTSGEASAGVASRHASGTGP